MWATRVFRVGDVTVFKVLVALAVVAVLVVALFVARRVVSAWRLSRGFDAFGEARKRRQRVVVTVTDEGTLWDVDALSVEGIVSGVTVGRGVLTVFMLGAPDGDASHPTVCFEFPMSVVRGFSVGERPMLRRLDWREDGGFAYVLRFTGGNGEMGADEAAARVREYGGSCWGLDDAVECERALNGRFPLGGGKLV